MTDLLKVEKRGRIAVITINRPDQMNALGKFGDGDVFAGLFADLEADTNIHCAVLTGAGRAFSAGGDLKAMQEKSGAFGGTPYEISLGYRDNIQKIIRTLWNFKLPLIVAINGAAAGLGCDLASLGDIRVISEKARFGMPFLRLGLLPGDGGAWLLPRIVGLPRASEMVLTGDLYDADTALAWGYATQKFAPEALMDGALELAGKVAAQPRIATMGAKQLLRKAQSSTFDQALDLVAAQQAHMHYTNDHMEGVMAVLEKRSPKFKGD